MHFQADAGDRVVGLLSHVRRGHVDEVLPTDSCQRVFRNDLEGSQVSVLPVPNGRLALGAAEHLRMDTRRNCQRDRHYHGTHQYNGHDDAAGVAGQQHGGRDAEEASDPNAPGEGEK